MTQKIFDELTPITSNAADNSENWKTVTLAFGFLIWESVGAIAFLEKWLSLIPLILLHIITVVIAMRHVQIFYQKGRDLRFPVMLMSAVFAAGPFGAAGVILVSFLYPSLARYFTPEGEWIKELFPFPSPLTENVYTRISVGWDDYTTPTEVSLFQDIFRYGTLSQKQTVLDTMVEHFDPIYSPLIKRTLEDPSNLIRIQAASIVTKIKSDMEDQLKKLQQLHLDQPRDSVTLLRLAQLLDAYAFMDFLDPDRKRKYQQQAFTYYREFLTGHPNHEKTWYDIGRLLFRQKDYAGVVKWFEEYQTKWEKLSPNALCWYLEALFELGEYDKVSLHAKSSELTTDSTLLHEDVIEAVKGWEHD